MRVADSLRYKSENGDRRLRRKRVAPLAAHHAMHQAFGRRIVNGGLGDSLDLAILSGVATVSCASPVATDAAGL